MTIDDEMKKLSEKKHKKRTGFFVSLEHELYMQMDSLCKRHKLTKVEVITHLLRRYFKRREEYDKTKISESVGASPPNENVEQRLLEEQPNSQTLDGNRGEEVRDSEINGEQSVDRGTELDNTGDKKLE